MEDEIVLLALSFCSLGALIGVIALLALQKTRLRTFRNIANEMLRKAEMEALAFKEAGEIALKKKQLAGQNDLEQLFEKEKRKLAIQDERLKEREDKVENRMSLVDKKLNDIEKREAALLILKEEVQEEKAKLEIKKEELTQQLEALSGLTSGEAKDLLLQRAENEVRKDSINFIKRAKREAEEEAEREATRIISTAIGRLAVPCISHVTVNTVSLPNDEMKGRIIGREGRNIKALEQATGVNFIIDDTPNAVVLSGFDPIRLHVAQTVLTELVSDGRIHPTRIEEAVENAKIQTKREIHNSGEDAALRAGIFNLHPEIIILLGKLKFRFSYGQNVLEHSLEVSHLMGLMAAELGLDIAFARRIGLLHDMGKSVSHEVQGSHAIIGHDLALKYGESQEVANGIGCHHHEMAPITIEGSLCHAADAISASRPGARIEAVEEYIRRLKDLENMALAFPGVEKAYALQAGRELRIFVQPDAVDDNGVLCLAKDLTKQIERDLKYRGRIKVSVTREKRVIEYAM